MVCAGEGRARVAGEGEATGVHACGAGGEGFRGRKTIGGQGVYEVHFFTSREYSCTIDHTLFLTSRTVYI